jgi:hypothetical protein
MLSSVLQQQGNFPSLTFSVAYPKNNGNPITEKVCSFFRGQGLNIREIPYPDMEVIQYRGLARNEQLKQATAEWLLFADTDMTYSPHFFENLGEQLETSLKDERRVISTSRVSLDKKHCIESLDPANDPNSYPCVIQGAGDLSGWPIYQISRNCGAGYFQLVNTSFIREKFGWYVDPSKCNDRSWRKGQKARSDQQFRSMVGGGVRKIVTLPQYHLNHVRDNEIGCHTEEQR